MLLLALIARGVFRLSLLIIVGTAVGYFWNSGNSIAVLASIAFFPLSYFIFPWFSGLQWIFLIGMAAYALSTSLGMRPVD